MNRSEGIQTVKASSGLSLPSPLWNARELFGHIYSFKFHRHSTVQSEEALCLFGAVENPA